MGERSSAGAGRGSPPDRILDAAGRCFADKGVAATTIGDIARAAACSRPTVYRYFDDRDALRTAFVHREARRVGARVLEQIGHVRHPGDRLVAAVLAALAEVRSNPTLAAWFSGGDASIASGVAGSSRVIESLVAPSVGELAGGDLEAHARWVVRVVLSLLTLPGRDEAEERAMLERFVVPVVVPASS